MKWALIEEHMFWTWELTTNDWNVSKVIRMVKCLCNYILTFFGMSSPALAPFWTEGRVQGKPSYASQSQTFAPTFVYAFQLPRLLLNLAIYQAEYITICHIDCKCLLSKSNMQWNINQNTCNTLFNRPRYQRRRC